MCIGMVAERATLLALSETTLEAVCEQIDAERREDGSILWNGKSYSEPLARGVAVYAGFLSSAVMLMAQAFSAQQLPGWACSFLIDRLPHEGSELRAMNLLEAVCKSRYVMSVIEQGLPDRATAFGCGYVSDIESQHGRVWGAKTNPGALLADWLARGFRARRDPGGFEDATLATPYSEGELETFGSIWSAARSHHEVHEYDLDLRRFVV